MVISLRGLYETTAMVFPCPSFCSKTSVVSVCRQLESDIPVSVAEIPQVNPRPGGYMFTGVVGIGLLGLCAMSTDDQSTDQIEREYVSPDQFVALFLLPLNRT